MRMEVYEQPNREWGWIIWSDQEVLGEGENCASYDEALEAADAELRVHHKGKRIERYHERNEAVATLSARAQSVLARRRAPVDVSTVREIEAALHEGRLDTLKDRDDIASWVRSRLSSAT